MRRVAGRCGVLVALGVGLSSCGTGDSSTASGLDGASPDFSEATCVPAWSPVWGQASGINSWWVEYAISGGTVTQAHLEVPGRGTVALTFMWNKWVGPSSFAIPTGTTVVLHARSSLGQAAQTLAFAYMVERAPLTDPCAGACAPSCTGKQCGDDGCGGSCGTCPADSTCEANTCVSSCVPSCTDRQCGSDGCGGSCGTCQSGFVCQGDVCAEACAAQWSPTWLQASGANTWWVEYIIGGAVVARASLEVPGLGTVDLSLRTNKWVGASGFRIPQGRQVILHAENSFGQTARSEPFAYLVDAAPTTEPCAGNDVVPPCPLLPAGLVTVAFDDSLASQYTEARGPMAARGIRATFYLVTRGIAEGWSGFLTLAQTRALAQDGHEIASHTVGHRSFELLTGSELELELSESQRWLEANIVPQVDHFASPYGVVGDTFVDAAKAYYVSYRGGVPGLNYVGDDVYRLKADGILRSMTPAQVRVQLEETRLNRGWRILVFHGISSAPSSDQFVYRVTDFIAVLDAILTSGLELVTVEEGVNRIRCGAASMEASAPRR